MGCVTLGGTGRPLSHTGESILSQPLAYCLYLLLAPTVPTAHPLSHEKGKSPLPGGLQCPEEKCHSLFLRLEVKSFSF